MLQWNLSVSAHDINLINMCFLSASISLLIMRSMTTKTKEFCDCSSACLWLYNFLSSFFESAFYQLSISFVKLRCGFCLALLCIGLKLCKTLFSDRMWKILTTTCSTVSLVNHWLVNHWLVIQVLHQAYFYEHYKEV